MCSPLFQPTGRQQVFLLFRSFLLGALVFSVQDYYKEKGIERNSFKCNVVEQLEVENMLRSLDISKSAGEDKISGQFLRDAAEVISSPLTYIMNLSLKSATNWQGSYPYIKKET